MSKKVRNTLIIVNALILLYFSCLLVAIIEDNIKINSIQNQTIESIIKGSQIITSALVTLTYEHYKIKDEINFINKINTKQSSVISVLTNNQTKITSLIVSLKEKNIEQDRDTVSLLTKYSKLLNEQNKIKKTLDDVEYIDLKDVDKIKKANFLIVNITARYGGSGSHIKINNKSYVLTCAHLVKNEDDRIMASDNMGTHYPLELIKIDKANDLALFQIWNTEKIPYFEISERYPKEGSKVILIGNPGKMVDVITEGIIAKIEENYYVITNLTYKGNSGGATLYRGKIIGITSGIYYYFTPPIVVNYTAIININTIEEFLKEIE